MSLKVSVNLCCYNSQKYLRETLDSITAQTYKDWELIIIDDGSTDSTGSIIQEYIKQGYPIVYRYQENKGLGYSRNEALKYSRGEYIAFIDHDDIWLPEKLEKQIPLFQDPEVGLVFCDTVIFNMAGKFLNKSVRTKYYTGNCFSKLFTDYFLDLPSVVIRRCVLDGVGGWFDPGLKIVEDGDLFLRIAYKWALAMVNEPLAKWRVHNASQTWSNRESAIKERATILDKFCGIFPDFAKRFRKEIYVYKMNDSVVKGMLLWKKGRQEESRRCLFPYIFRNKKAFLLYLVSFFPEKVVMPVFSAFSDRVDPHEIQ